MYEMLKIWWIWKIEINYLKWATIDSQSLVAWCHKSKWHHVRFSLVDPDQWKAEDWMKQHVLTCSKKANFAWGKRVAAFRPSGIQNSADSFSLVCRFLWIYQHTAVKIFIESSKMKYILVTGGVISGIGKGVISSSIGALLKGCGLHVTSIKIDPYLNIDAGTFSPYEHGN